MANVNINAGEITSVRFNEQPADVDTPAAGYWALYFKAGGLYAIDDGGLVTGPFTNVCNIFFNPYSNEPPAAAYATLDLRNVHPVLDFDADTDESAIFTGILPSNYSGGGLTVYIHWMATSDTNAAHMCRWDAAIERCNTDLDSDSFAAAQSATGNPNATSGIITVTSIAFTDGAQMDSLAAGETFRLKITRDANHVTDDDMTGDAEVVMIEVRET